MSLQDKYNRNALEILDRVCQNENGSFNFDGAHYDVDEEEKLVLDVKNYIELQALSLMSHARRDEFSKVFWADHKVI